MNKQKFLAQLSKRLYGLPQDDIEERLTFYSEMIEDRMEEGLSEEEAVSAVGSVDEIAAQIVVDIPLVKADKKTNPKRQLKAWEIVLLILGSPIWFSLAVAVFAVFLSLYASLWSVIISLWAVLGALIGCTVGGIIAGISFSFVGSGLVGVSIIGASFVCTGLSIFLFFGCKAATKGTLLLTKNLALGIKICFVKKEEA